MRKISILNEDYIALEQRIAEALDGAEQKIQASYSSMEEKLEAVCSQVEDKQNFHMDPVFINFKSEFDIEGMIQSLDSDLSKMAFNMRKLESVSIEMTAYLSKVHEFLSGEEVEAEDEVAELVMFFGSKDNTNIPNSPDNQFIVTLSDAAKSESIQRMIEIRTAFEDMAELIMQSLSSGGNMEGFKESMKNLAVLEDLVIEFSGKDLNEAQAFARGRKDLKWQKLSVEDPAVAHNVLMGLLFVTTMLLSPIMIGGFASGGPGPSTSIGEIRKKLPKIISFIDNALKKIESDEILKEVVSKTEIEQLENIKKIMENNLSSISNEKFKDSTRLPHIGKIVNSFINDIWKMNKKLGSKYVSKVKDIRKLEKEEAKKQAKQLKSEIKQELALN